MPSLYYCISGLCLSLSYLGQLQHPKFCCSKKEIRENASFWLFFLIIWLFFLVKGQDNALKEEMCVMWASLCFKQGCCFFILSSCLSCALTLDHGLCFWRIFYAFSFKDYTVSTELSSMKGEKSAVVSYLDWVFGLEPLIWSEVVIEAQSGQQWEGRWCKHREEGS